MKRFKYIKEYIFKYKFNLFVFLLFSTIAWILSIVSPYLTGNYIDVLVEAKSSEAIINFTIKVLLIGILNIISSFITSYSYLIIQTKAMTDLNFYVLNHVIKLPILYFEDIDSTYLNQRINADSNTVISFVLGNILSVATNTLTIIFLIYISIKINAKLTSVLIPLIPVYLFLYFTFRNPLYRHGYILKEEQGKFFSKMNEYLQNVNLTKKNATFEEADNELNYSFMNMFSSLLKYTKMSYIFSSSNSMIMTIAQIVIFFFGGFEILNGNLTVGKFTIINSYFSMIMNSIGYFLGLGKSYQNALISHDRLNQLFDEKKEINGEIQLESINTIQLNNISFSYGNSKNMIHNFNYSFEKGKVYFIVGENGTGKSTLINLISGIFNDYYKGQILYNSIDIKELDMYYIRKRCIGISEQEPKLINNSILNNITYGIKDYKLDDINILLEELNLDVDKFNERLNTNMYEVANNISGGEKLKISLASTILKNPDVIILDEPTSAMDINSIERLKSIIKEIKKEKIIIIVTHDKEFIDLADEVLNLNI